MAVRSWPRCLTAHCSFAACSPDYLLAVAGVPGVILAAAIPTGSGGHWSRVVLDGEIAPGANNQILIGLFLDTNVSWRPGWRSVSGPPGGGRRIRGES